MIIFNRTPAQSRPAADIFQLQQHEPIVEMERDLLQAEKIERLPYTRSHTHAMRADESHEKEGKPPQKVVVVMT